MTEVEAVAAVLQSLERASIPAMLVGSLSSNAYGIERSTKDADFVVQLGSLPLSRLLRELPEGFILEPQIGFETITSSIRYRLRYEPLAFLIKIFEVTDDPHDQLRFQHRVETTFGGVRAFLPRPEDVVITKLRWSKGGRRSKDIDDVQNVLSVQQGKLDLPYIRHWCAQYNTLDLFEKTLASLPPLP